MTIKHLFPKAKPVLNLDFANAKELDRRITFTRASIATYVGSDGLIKTAASGEARFDHDPVTGESLGLLIEKGTTNLLTHSNDFAYTNPGNPNASWALNGGGAGGTTPVLTPNYTTAPDGTNTAWRLQCNLTSGTTSTDESFLRGPFIATSSHCTGTIWVKSNTGANQTIMFTIHSIGGSVFTVTPEWTRINHTYVVNPNMQIGFKGNVTGPGSCDISIWGAQLEVGDNVVTSYIPTNGSKLTRAADVASVTNSGIYNTNSFTILNEPFGSAGGGSTLSLVGGGEAPIKRTAVYSQELTQTQINTLVGKTDEFWRWRVFGISFGLPHFTTDGQVTVDWGDGTPLQILTTSTHTFADGGGYHEVGFRLDSGTYFRPSMNNNAAMKDRVVAVGPAPESMKLRADYGFFGCTKIAAFDATVDATGGTNFQRAWKSCTSLTSFPLINTSSGTDFGSAWDGCNSLTTFPASFFDSWTGTPANDCFTNAWSNCPSLTATSVEKILNSIDTSGRSAPASGVGITIDYDAGSGTPSIATAVTNLKARGWTITLNGAAQ